MTAALRQSFGKPAGFDVYIDHVARRVDVVGELDIATVPLMVEAAASLPTDRSRDITIDLEWVTFIGAAAFDALVGLSNAQQAQCTVLHVIGNAHVRRIADLCRLESLLR